MELKEKIIDVSTGEETIRILTAEEVAEIEKGREEAEVRTKAAAEKEMAKLALLEKLGITQDEAKLLTQ